MRFILGLALLIVFASSVSAQQPVQSPAAARISQLEKILPLVEKEKRRAQTGHDLWIASLAEPNTVLPQQNFGARGRLDWQEALATINRVNDQLYSSEPINLHLAPQIDTTQPHPNDPGPGVANKEMRGLHAHRAYAFTKIDLLISRMTTELAALRAANPQ